MVSTRESHGVTDFAFSVRERFALGTSVSFEPFHLSSIIPPFTLPPRDACALRSRPRRSASVIGAYLARHWARAASSLECLDRFRGSFGTRQDSRAGCDECAVPSTFANRETRIPEIGVARRRTSYNEEGVRYAREKIGDVDEDGDGDGDGDGEAPTDHLLTFLAPVSLVRTSPAVCDGRSGSARSHRSGPRSGQATVCAGDADSRGRRDDSRPQPAAPRRRDAVIQRSATGDRGGGSAPPRIIVVGGGGGGGGGGGDGGICPTVDRGRIVPEITAVAHT